MEINQYSEDSLTLEFEDKISPEINQLIVNLEQWMKDQEIVGLIETVISFTNLLIYFDPMKTSREEIIKTLDQVDFEALRQKPLPSRIFDIPVCYGGKYGPDLDLFEENGLTPEEVINLHADKEYLVYMLGFMPGFVYLGGLDERIFKDRLNNPRTNIPAGSVGIGGKQTGMYPFDSPGGWNLLGRTPIRLYDTRRGEDTILYGPGDKIVFKPITEERYEEILKEVEEGTYQVPVREGNA